LVAAALPQIVQEHQAALLPAVWMTDDLSLYWPPDEEAAGGFLRHINYYRFSGYGLAFEQSRHQFILGTTFGQIRDTYEFDRALRD